MHHDRNLRRLRAARPLHDLAVALLLLWLLLLCIAASAAEKLPALGTARNETSVSGISSGAAMAVQFGVMHSSIVIVSV